VAQNPGCIGVRESIGDNHDRAPWLLTNLDGSFVAAQNDDVTLHRNVIGSINPDGEG
jgi:hypothetical protein